MRGTLVPEKCSEGAPLVCTTDPVARGCARLSGSNCACSLVLTTSNGVTESSSDLIRLDSIIIQEMDDEGTSEGRRRQTEEGSGDAAGGGGEDLLAQGELFGGHAPHAEPATGLRFKRLLHVCCVLRVVCCCSCYSCAVLGPGLAWSGLARITRNTSQRAPIPETRPF